MKVFVTGGAGFVGSHMAARLVREGHTVTAYDRLSLGKCDHRANRRAVGACTRVEADLLGRGREKSLCEFHPQRAAAETFKACEQIPSVP